MRLIDTRTLELRLFSDPVAESYAILSHTWADKEVTFQNMEDLSIARLRKGFAKIENTCRIAASKGLRYAWIDTCCIDKTSSAELSEAINSMFVWYKNAVVCYASLFDLPPQEQSTESGLHHCRWFTRGWTLQELIAPETLLFLDVQWNVRGAKAELTQQISIITGIDQMVLLDWNHLKFSLYTERSLQSSSRRSGYINPFTNLEDYGPLGDPFSLSALSPGNEDEHELFLQHSTSLVMYHIVVKATLNTIDQPRSFTINLSLHVRQDHSWRERLGSPDWAGQSYIEEGIGPLQLVGGSKGCCSSRSNGPALGHVVPFQPIPPKTNNLKTQKHARCAARYSTKPMVKLILRHNCFILAAKLFPDINTCVTLDIDSITLMWDCNEHSCEEQFKLTLPRLALIPNRTLNDEEIPLYLLRYLQCSHRCHREDCGQSSHVYPDNTTGQTYSCWAELHSALP